MLETDFNPRLLPFVEFEPAVFVGLDFFFISERIIIVLPVTKAGKND